MLSNLKCIKVPLLICLLLVARTGLSQDLNQIDGKISQEEFRTLKVIYKNDDTQILADTSQNRYLKLVVLSEELYVSSLCICNNQGDVTVLHASVALGQISYQKGKDSWSTQEKFDWQMREQNMSPSTISLRRKYLKENGWIANTVTMGNKGEIEFIIDRQVFGERIKIALGLMSAASPEDIIAIPAKYASDCADHKLVSGDPSSSYQFENANWLLVPE